MYYKKYEGDRIYLSPICVDDYLTYTKWLNDESLSSGLGNYKEMISEISEKEFLEKCCKDCIDNFSIVLKDGDKLIGNYGLEVINSVSKRYHIGGFIGEKENRGLGYGTEALKLITKYAFEILNAETIFSGIYEFNEASLKSAKKSGYSIIGKYRNSYYYCGKYYDEYCIEITRDDYFKNKDNK